MHDIDRIRLETQSETGMFEAVPFEAEQFEFAQSEAPWGETSEAFGEMGEALGEMGEAFGETSETGEAFGETGETSGETGEVFSETEQMELASELLEVTNEAEFDRFLGDLIGRAGQAIGRFVKSPEGRAIGGLLKGAAKQVLPGIGSAVGGYLGGTTGAKLGGDLASAAGRVFGLELEGLSGEDREFEVARRYVTFAGEAVKNLASAPVGSDPRTAANAAMVATAKAYAPGLLSPVQAGMEPQAPASLVAGRSGRWVRRGAKIILYGI
jgi:hypothetical protein